MKLNFATFDVFTSTPYRGNPLAIVHVPVGLRESLSQDQKLLIAREFNLSESVFLHEQSEDEKAEGDVKIDIFTPVAEVPFAGHPTIGTANYLLRYLAQNPDWKHVKALQAKAGRMPIELVASLPGTGGVEGVRLAVAHNVHRHQNRLEDPKLMAGYPLEPREGFDIGKYPIVSSVKGMTFILAQLANLDDLKDKPRESLIGTKNTYKSQHLLDEGWQVGILVSYFFVDLGYDEDGVRLVRTRTLSRVEDPATGSAASALCAHLSLSEKGKRERRYKVTQGVEIGRKSEILVTVTLGSDEQSIEQIVLSGTAVRVMEGSVEVPED